MTTFADLKQKRIFALDYGRGTMAGFWCDPMHVELFKPIMDSEGETSGMAKLKNGGYCLGGELFVLDGPAFLQSEKLYLNIKGLPDGEDALQIEYARAWRKKIETENPELFNGCEAVWIIGCPTAKEWRHKAVIENYRRIFEQAGFSNVIVIPESNAALMCLQKQHHLLDKFDEAKSDVGVLCIDLGAYSSDATYVLPGKVQSVGGYVGASLIERMILAKNLEGDLIKRDRNSARLRESVSARCKKDKTFAEFLLVHAKKLKETYFKASAQKADFSRKDAVETVEICMEKDDNNWEDFSLAVNKDMMRAIIEVESVKSVLKAEFDELTDEVKSYIGDMTWADCLRKFAREVAAHFPEYENAVNGQSEGTPSLVLTGGASLMPIVRDIIVDVFPYAEIYRDNAPMSTIAKGLLCFGPDKIRAMELFEHLSFLTSHNSEGNEAEEKDSVLNSMASNAHNKLGLELLDSTVAQMINVLVAQVNRWKEREIESTSIVPNARNNFKYWFENTMISEYDKYKEGTKSFLADELNKLYQPLLKRLGVQQNFVKKDDIHLEYAEKFIQFWRSLFSTFDAMIEEEKDIYDKLPNPGFFTGLFGTSRAEVLAAIAEQLDARNEKWRDQVSQTLFDIFNSPEVYGPFKVECLVEIAKVIDARSKSISHDLLLEETFDDE